LSDRFILIGHPVGHSISPAIHREAYRLLGREAEYSLVDCPDEEAVRVQVEAIRRGELSGANVTVPWKQTAFDLADVHDATASDVGVANVLARDAAGKIVAYNTDAMALGSELRSAVESSGVETKNRPAALVIGNGGAALASVVGCRLAGITQIGVTARRFDPKVSSAEWPRAEQFRRLGAQLLPWFDTADQALLEFMSRTHLLVQATSAGMRGIAGGDDLVELIPWSALSSTVAYDLVYTPPETPFLRRAQQEGHFAVGGLGMLVGQAAQAIQIWWGQAPEPSDLTSTAQKALGL
jgi:shikimate dehydrogenase